VFLLLVFKICSANMKDCFGVEYRLVSMHGNGLCGYSCLAYALSTHRKQYTEVVEHFFKAFQANPHLFIQQKEFARRNSNLTHYVNQMSQAMANVRWRSVPGILWMEDAHLVAFALMYDVCLCLIRCDENSMFIETVAERVIYVSCPQVVILMSWKDYSHTERHRFHGRPRNSV